LALAGEPVMGGAEGFGGVCGTLGAGIGVARALGSMGVVVILEVPLGEGGGVNRAVCGRAVASLAMLGIGLVTAVDHAGGTLETGAGVISDVPLAGDCGVLTIVARGAGVIRAEAGFSGRGGRLMRSVSRLGAFGSEPSGLAGSAIDILFYSYSGKCSMAKFAIVTYLCS
jgi:hypothetical protein